MTAAKFRFKSASLAGAALALASAPAFALPNVVYVSGKGNDANTCDAVAAPCLTFVGAHGKVAAGGEIVVLDAASYGPVTITKSVSIVNDGTGVADIQQTASAAAITVNAGAAGVVHLRGLSLDGAGASAAGVRLNSAASLTIVNCVARRFTAAGFYIAPSTVATLAVTDSIASDSSKGFHLVPISGGSIKGVLVNVQAVNNVNYGVYASGASALTMVGGFASKNGYGVIALGGAAIMARDATSSNNTFAGFYSANTGSILRLAHSVASGNATGVAVGAGGLAESYRDNNLRGNTSAAYGNFQRVLSQ